MPILDTFKKTIIVHGLIRKNSRVVAGVSGGPDSVALLYLLAALRKEYSLQLSVAHFDHGLRKDSKKDAAFVRGLAVKLGCGFYCERAKPGSLAHAGSVEEAARTRRFDFFRRVAKKVRADRVALGHTIDDQAETVLMRILRGSGLYGLAGIIPCRLINGVTFIRPLIGIRRKEIESFLKRKRIRSRLDESNKEDLYFRNKVRNRLIPLLEREFAPGIKEALVNLAESARFDYDYLDLCARRASSGNRSSYSLAGLSRMHTAIRRIALRNAYASLKGDTRRLTFRHIQEIECLTGSRPPGSIVDLPGGISVVKTAKNLRFYKRKNSRNT